MVSEFHSTYICQLVKNPPAMWETWIWSLGWKDFLQKGKVTHSRILAWRIPWTMQSMGSQSVGRDWETLTFTFPPTGHKDLFFFKSLATLLLIPCLLDNTYSDRYEVIVIGVLMCVFLIINDVEHHFMFLLALYMSPLEKHPFSFCASFLSRLFFSIELYEFFIYFGY